MISFCTSNLIFLRVSALLIVFLASIVSSASRISISANDEDRILVILLESTLLLELIGSAKADVRLNAPGRSLIMNSRFVGVFGNEELGKLRGC